MSNFIPKLSHISLKEEAEYLLRREEESLERGIFHHGYYWNHSYVSPLAMCQIPPPGNYPTTKWALKLGETLLEVIANTIAIDASSKQIKDIEAKIKTLETDVKSGRANFKLIKSLVSDIASHGRLLDENGKKPTDIDDYAKLFNVIGLPAVSSTYNQDSNFAAMRTAGPNPLMIERLRQFMPHFPVTNKHYQAVMGPADSLERALHEERLFVCDYKALNVLKSDPNVQPRKYLYAPIALFAEHIITKQLIPVAIQPQQKPGPDSPIYIADGSYDWLIAKTIVEMADGNYHEAVSHLGRTHFFVEPFVVATGRNFDKEHPVAKLLWPHFEGTLFINFAAVFTLIAKGGQVDQLLNGTLESTLDMTVKGVEDYPFNQNFLPKTFKARGVENLHNYAYRDDSMLYWKAIKQWVGNYLSQTYQQNPSKDVELRRWYDDLVSYDGGRVVGFGEHNKPIESIDYLVDALTMIIFTSSVQHATVNFPQYDLMSYCPNMPLAAYAQFPKMQNGQALPGDAQQYLSMLPPMERAKLQLDVGFGLGTVHYTELGQYTKAILVRKLMTVRYCNLKVGSKILVKLLANAI